MSRKVGAGGLITISIGSAFLAALLITIWIEAIGGVDSGLLFFAYFIGTMGIAIFTSIALYDRVLKEKINWSF